MVHDEMFANLVELATKNGWIMSPKIAMTIDLEGVSYASLCYLIFSKSFAKAIYGDTPDEPCDVCLYEHNPNCSICGVGWKYHLPIQVLSDDPLKYMYENRRKS